MIAKTELEKAIDECEHLPISYQNCEKLATFYAIYDHLYAEKEPKEQKSVYTETVIDDYGDSEFFMTIQGKDSKEVWKVLDELMSTLQVVNPKLYNATLRKIDSV